MPARFLAHVLSHGSAACWTHDKYSLHRRWDRPDRRSRGGPLQQRDIAVRIGARSTGFDRTRSETWAPAIGGADSAYITYSPDVAVPAAAGDIAQSSKIAVAQGVRRFVMLSGRGEPEAADAERELFAAAPSATVLRASWMNQTFSEGRSRRWSRPVT